MHVHVREVAEIRVFAIRHVGPYLGIGEAFGKLHATATQHALAQRPGTQMIAVYHDDPRVTPGAQLRSDAGVSVTPDQKPIEGLTELEIPEGVYAISIHRGPYDGLPAAWAALRDTWLPSSGRQLAAGPSLEIYQNSPMDTKPEDLETELYLPLAR